MPLNRKHGAPAPSELALFWPMSADDGARIDVYVFASSLQAFDADPTGPVGLLKRHRALLETIASEKFDRESFSPHVPLHITTDDILTWMRPA